MTTTMQAPPITGRPPVTMKLLTPSADRQLRGLPPEDLARTVEVLCQPVPPRECELVHQLAKHRVSHFGIRGTRTAVRVCFRLRGAEACIVHVGTHAEFDRFAGAYSGNFPQRFLSLEETLAMLKSASASRVNGHTTTASAPPSSAPVSKGSDIRDCLQLLSDALLEAVDQRSSQRAALLGEELASVRRSLTTHCDEAVEKLSQRALQQEQELSAAREQWLRKGSETSTQLGDLAARVSRTGSLIDQTRDKLAAAIAARGEQIAAMEGRLDLFARDTESCLAEWTSRAEAHGILTATQIAAVSSAVSAAQSQLAALVSHQQHLDGQLAEVQAVFRDWVAAQNRNAWVDAYGRAKRVLADSWHSFCQAIQTVLARLSRRKASPQLLRRNLPNSKFNILTPRSSPWPRPWLTSKHRLEFLLPLQRATRCSSALAIASFPSAGRMNPRPPHSTL